MRTPAPVSVVDGADVEADADPVTVEPSEVTLQRCLSP